MVMEQSARCDASEMRSDSSSDALYYDAAKVRRRSVGTIVNGTEVMRFAYQAESSVSDPAASRHRDVVLRAALPAAELRANVDFGVLTAGTGAAEAHGLAQRAASFARTFIRAASPHW